MDELFLKYDKIPLGTVGRAAVGSSDEFVATEKIHGANFSVLVEATSGCVSFGKRTAVLEPTDDFYSFRSAGLDRRLAAQATALLDSLRRRFPRLQAFTVYGELFGGRYEHPALAEGAAPGPRLQPVQCGVWYSPNIEFMAFDLAISLQEEEERAEEKEEDQDGSAAARPGPNPTPRFYLDFDEARALAEEAGFLFVQPLVRGSLAACLEHGERFPSTIAARLGLPTLADANLAEGIVCRPVREPRRRGDGGGRGLFKLKIAEFSERQYENTGWRASKAGGAGAGTGLAARDLARFEMLALVTPQRLDNVLSKTGRIDYADKEACRMVG